ncbi:hypothetical protein [Bacteroides congonensis]|uniref:hypothetical protein n=1 Tax=Bacteroides congonensis TaxID=1871006 RepID=UPI002FD97F90
MKNKAVVVVVVLGSLIIAMFTGCWQSPLKYIPPRVDSINSDKSRMGLNGKVKTVVRNSIVQEKYDEQGRSVDERPGFEILYKNFQDYDYDVRVATGLKQRISKIMLILARGSVVY